MPTLYWCPHQVLKAIGAPECPWEGLRGHGNEYEIHVIECLDCLKKGASGIQGIKPEFPFLELFQMFWLVTGIPSKIWESKVCKVDPNNYNISFQVWLIIPLHLLNMPIVHWQALTRLKGTLEKSPSKYLADLSQFFRPFSFVSFSLLSSYHKFKSFGISKICTVNPFL